MAEVAIRASAPERFVVVTVAAAAVARVVPISTAAAVDIAIVTLHTEIAATHRLPAHSALGRVHSTRKCFSISHFLSAEVSSIRALPYHGDRAVTYVVAIPIFDAGRIAATGGGGPIMKFASSACVIVFSAALGCAACGGSEASMPMPTWLQSKIDQFKASPPKNPPVQVYSCRYNNQDVYYITPYCCDVYGELYDSTGNLLCYPDGGISGTGDGRCSDFFQNRTGVVLVWKDNR